MNLIIKKNILLKAVNIVEHIIGRNLTLPVLNNILIKTNNNTLNITATDLEIAVSIDIPAKIEKQGSLTIPPRILNTFLSNLPEGNIELKSEKNNFYLKQDNYKTLLKGESIQEYPLLPKINKEDFFVISSIKLTQSLSQVINSSASSDIKPELMGVLFFLNGSELKLVSTDSFRLSEKTLHIENNKKIKTKIIIPSRAIQEIIRVYQNLDEDIYVYINKNQIVLENKNNETFHVQFISKLIEGHYPEYSQIIPEKFETTTHLSKKEFTQQIKTASSFASKLNDVILKITSKKIEIHSEDYDIGDFNSFIEASSKGEDKELVLNYHYLLDGLENIKGDEIVIKMNQKENPVLLESTKEKNYFYILMPIRG